MANEKQYQYVLPKGFVLKGGENDYVIEQVLGKGGFGVTYKVRSRIIYKNIKIDAFFAVKEYFPNICSREADNATIKIPDTMQQEIVDGKKDFINEGLKLQEVCKLNPNIVNVNEVFEANGTAYYVLEYLEGGDLRKMVRDNGKPLTEQQMLEIMTPIGYALQCLHDNRLLHLDVKPDNVVMRIDHADGSTEPALIDFGISTHFNIDGTPTSKTPSQGISPGYSPIEQYAQVNHFDPRIDVYAFCATCFYMLTGKDPIVSMEMTPEYVKNSLPNGISANVIDAIERGMAMAKNTRVASINELLSMMAGTPLKVEKKGDLKPKPAKKGKDTVKLKEEEEALKPARDEWARRMPKASKRNDDKAKGRSKRKLIYLVSLFLIALLSGFVIWKTQGCSFMTESEKERIINDYVNSMVYVEGGAFTMGATSEQGDDAFDEEKPAHEVTLSSYYIGQTEVTQELWEAVMGDNPSEFKGAKLPVETVSWDDCQEFIRKLNEKTGKNFRLPTEAEWEYAARGGNHSKGYKYSGSNTIDDVAWYYDNSGNTTHEVAGKRANELGIYDMSGNVYEWCNDWYGDYSSSSQTDPRGATEGSDRVNRGGGWFSIARRCRVADRGDYSPGYRDYYLGLRLAL